MFSDYVSFREGTWIYLVCKENMHDVINLMKSDADIFDGPLCLGK